MLLERPYAEARQRYSYTVVQVPSCSSSKLAESPQPGTRHVIKQTVK